MEKENELDHTEDWGSYMSNVDGVIGSLFVDLGLIEIAPVVDKPNLTWVSISMQNPREDGLSSSEESDLLYAIEDALVDSVKDQHSAIFAGRLTSDGMRQLFFYFGDTAGYEKTIARSMSKYPDYEFDCGTKEDAEWDGYLDFLYPEPSQYRMIMNGRVVMNLEQAGDNLTKERMVDHWIYFETESDMQNYISEIEKQNFEVIGSNQNEDNIYVLNVGRVDKADYHSVNEYVLYLWELANEHNGEYDGWGCPIQKD